MTSAVAVATDRIDAPAAPAYGGEYVEGVAGAPQYLNPIIAATTLDQDVARLVFTGLTRYDGEGRVVTDLARIFTSDADGKIWTFDLRDDVRWHDGAPLTADDVVYTVGLIQDKAYVGTFSEAFRGVVTEKLGPLSIRFTLPDVYGAFADSTTFGLLPAHLLRNVSYADLAGHRFNAQPVGTGPFKVQDVDQRQVTLVRNDDFYRAKPARTRPYLDRVILRSYADASQALGALARGEIDGAGGFDVTDAERATTLRNVSLHRLPTNDFTAMFLNMRPERPMFRDRAVRQAIATAIDRRQVLRVAAGGGGALAHQFVPSTSWAYAPDVRRYEHSAKEAAALLDAADWKDHDGDGVRDKGGVVLNFTLTTSDEPARAAAAAQIVNDLRSVGMWVELRTMPFGELVERAARQRTFDALLVGISATSDPDPYSFFHSSQAKDPGHNFSGYSTLAMDRNLENARRTSDREKRRELYAPVFQTIAQEVPVVFLYFSDYLYAQHQNVRGIGIVPINDPPQRFWNVEDWYIRTKRG